MVEYRLCENHATCGGKTPVKSRVRYCKNCYAQGFRARPANQFTAPSIPTPDAPVVSPAAQIQVDRNQSKQASELANLRIRYKEALNTIDEKDRALNALATMASSVNVLAIEPHEGSGTSEATVVAQASDWHSEELVGNEVGGLNVFNAEIRDERITTFFQGVLRLTRLLQQDVRIDNMVLALLGDFISGNIHGEESAESNELQPTHALIVVLNHIISGIDFFLNHSKLKLTIPCASGNHARTTIKTRFSAENGHSLEFLLYRFLALHYANEPRVTFLIPEGIHSYMDVYGKRLRFHHGHAIKYGGGVGGITIPVNKAIANWDQAVQADVDVFGHFHQRTIHRKFICNGSLIGYNGFALAIKAQFEEPSQNLFLVDKKRGVTCHWPILFKR